MDKKDGTYALAVNAAVAGMAHETHSLGPVALPKSFGRELQNSHDRKVHGHLMTPSVFTDFRRDGFDRSDLLLDFDELNHSNSQNYQKGRRLMNCDAVFGSPVSKLKNAMALQNGQSLCKQEMGRYGLANQPSKIDKLQAKALRNRTDMTRRSVSSDSNGSQVGTVGSEDVYLAERDDSPSERVSLEPVSCSVCGDTVAGFHCGAYVCEACKKFFVRCLKHDAGMKFTCAHNKSCEMTKETRTQCPSCRFQKCLQLGMYKPGGPNISSEIGHIPCKVCGAPSSGFHFGAITCEGCKGFFRRTVKERDSLKYQCSRNGSCVITWKTRNICKMCRYRQCLKAGMKPDKSRIGRQPNSVKHATMLELNQIKTAKGLVPLTFPACEFKSEPVDFIECGGKTNFVTLFDSNNHEIVQMLTASCENLIHCGAAELGMEDDVVMELEPGTDVAEMKSENLQRGDGDWMRRDMPRCERDDDTYQYISSGKNFHVPTPSPSPSDPFTGSHSQYTTPDSDSLRPVTLPPRDEEAFCEKFLPTDVGRFEMTCCDIPRAVPFAKPVSLPNKSSSPLPDHDSVISIIQHSYKDLSVILSRSDREEITATSTLPNIWDSMMTQFAHCAQATLRFAKKVPGFRKFAISEQIHMVQSGMFPIVVVVLSLMYDEVNERFCYFMYSQDEMRYILRKFEPFRLLSPAFHHMGRKVRQLGLDETEIAFLCGLHLMDSGNKHIYKELLLDSLEEYIKKKFGQVCDRNGQILLCLSDMVTTNHIHQQAVNALMCPGGKYSYLEIPQLFKESFIGMDD